MYCTNCLPTKNRSYFFAITFLLLNLLTSFTLANNEVVVFTTPDTLWSNVGENGKIDIWIENDVRLGSMSLGFEIYSPDGASWDWVAEQDGYGTFATLRVIPGSRMDPAAAVWDGDLQVNDNGFDEISPDSILISGSSETAGLEPGPLEKMLSLTIKASSPVENQVFTICVDSAFIPPSGDWLFADASTGTPIIPDFAGSFCFPVKERSCCPPWIFDCPFSTITVDHCEFGTASVGAMDNGNDPPLPISFSIAGHTGEGSAVVDGWDGTGTVVYTPRHTEVGNTVIVTVQVCNSQGCETCEVAFYIDGSPPTIDAGASFNGVGINNTFTKSDITADDPDLCDLGILSYFIISGPGEIDPSSGLYSWTPILGDVGTHEITIAVTDDVDTAQDSFQLTVVETEMWAGNANCDDNVNLADASFIINYIFYAGCNPPIPNWADANADCSVNLGDAAYIINYIFQEGDDPLPGCVE